MSRFMSAVWLVQGLVLLAVTLVLLVRPATLFRTMQGCQTAPTHCVCPLEPPPELRQSLVPAAAPRCCVPRGLCRNPAECCEPVPAAQSAAICDRPLCPGCDQMLAAGVAACIMQAPDQAVARLFLQARMLAPFLFAFALISFHAAMREDEKIRRSIAFIFAFVYVALAILISTGAFSDSAFSRPDFGPRVLLAALISLVLFSLLQVFRARENGQRLLASLAAAAYGILVALDLKGASISHLTWAAGGVFLFDTLLGNPERFRARLFTMILIFPAVFVATDSLVGGLFRDRYHAAAAQTFVTAAMANKPLSVSVFLNFIFFGLLSHALYAVWPLEPAAHRLSGTANTRPPTLWVVWLGQGILFLLWAALYLWGSHLNLWRHLFAYRIIDPGYKALLLGLRSVYPPLLVAMALFSFSSMQSSREWLWKARCVIFLAFWASVLLNLIFIWDDNILRWQSAALVIMPVAFGALHIKFYKSYGSWFSEEVGEGPDGWILIDLVLGPMLLLRTLLTGQRATHARGVAAWGKLAVLPADDRRYPAHEFFVPGREFPLQIRFANASAEDDAAADVRGAAIRLSVADTSPFDLLLNTGAFAQAANVLEMGTIAVASRFGRYGQRWLARYRRFLEGGIAGLRRAPESYTQLTYYSQTVRFWVGQDNERYLVRYRLVPWPPPERESGLPVTRADFIDRRRSPRERRPPDYLRRELKMRLEGALHDTLRLQAQFHKIRPGDSIAWYNPATDWDPGEHPFVDIAELTLEDVLSESDAEKLCYNPDNAPSSLGTPIAYGLTDYRSIADSERRVMRRVQALRKWMYLTFGLPSRSPKAID